MEVVGDGMFVHTGSGVSGRSDGCRASVYLLGLFLGALSVTLLVFAMIMLNSRQPLNLRASNSKHLILFLLQAGLVFRSSHSDCESCLISGTQATAAVTPGACFAMAGAEAHEIKLHNHRYSHCCVAPACISLAKPNINE